MPKSLIIICVFSLLVSCNTTTYYVVRHAEKSENTMTSDVPLSDAGQQRAEALREKLKNKGINTIYTTRYLRTKSTAKPLADAVGITMQEYDPRDTTFSTRLLSAGTEDRGNTLIVGHSNTVDDIVNKLSGKTLIPGDLPETQYGDLFILKKKGKKIIFRQEKFGL